ncbi:MAG: M20/M25/M40 family metallo-hydrolase [Peptococcaceae bacterium]|nr:M20/M25/M40 family metallo-hydrolase [Peptococcaceae bacterium]
MVDAGRMVAEFLEMVKVDSVSGKERDMADLVKARLKDMGLDPVEDGAGNKINSSAGNIIARLPGTGKAGPPVMVCAHLDTVEPGRGIKPVVEEGIIRSSGDTILGGDDKAGIAIILEVLRMIRENRIDHPGVEVVFTVFEEGGLLGAKNLDPGMLEARLGYVLDSGGPPGTIITSAPTQDRISVAVRGKSAHAGICPENGVNAIEIAARAIAGLRMGRIDHETTVNIGVITGGKATNIVPDSVFVQGETRSLDRAKKELQTRLIVEKFNQAASASGAGVDVRVENLYREYSIGEDREVVRLAVEAAEKLGIVPRLESTGGGSDANVFNEMGIPTVVLGIAMQKVHTTEEFIRIGDMVTCCRYLLEIIKAAGEKKQP